MVVSPGGHVSFTAHTGPERMISRTGAQRPKLHLGRGNGVVAGEGSVGQIPAITEALSRLCGTPLITPSTALAPELSAGNERAALAMRQRVEKLLERLREYDAHAREQHR